MFQTAPRSAQADGDCDNIWMMVAQGDSTSSSKSGTVNGKPAAASGNIWVGNNGDRVSITVWASANVDTGWNIPGLNPPPLALTESYGDAHMEEKPQGLAMTARGDGTIEQQKEQTILFSNYRAKSAAWVIVKSTTDTSATFGVGYASIAGGTFTLTVNTTATGEYASMGVSFTFDTAEHISVQNEITVTATWQQVPC
jgi:hypothetical protein